MPEPISIPYRVLQGPASETTYKVWVVSPGKKFLLKEVEVIFPAGVDGYLELSLYHGIRKIAPQDGVWQLDEGRVVARVVYEFGSGEVVLLLAKNTHSTNTYSASLQLEGELI